MKEILPSTTTGVVPAVVFHGVNGENFQTADSPSWYNPHEAAQVFYYVNECLRLGLKSENIGIITPYTKQVFILLYLTCTEKLNPKNRCVKFDSYCGRLNLIFLKWEQ